MRRLLASAVIAIACLAPSVTASASNPQPEAGGVRSAILVLIPGAPGSLGYDQGLLTGLERLPGLSPGLVSSTQGSYSRDQALLDISQGTRVSRSTYSPEEVPPISLVQAGPGARIGGWDRVLRRAATAPQTIEPGLLAASIPGGAALVLASGSTADVAFPASDRQGVVRLVREVSPGDQAQTIRNLARRFRLVVVVAGAGREGIRTVRNLIDQRTRGELLIATQLPPAETEIPVFGIGAVGLEAEADGALSSDSTNRDGMVAGIDIAPTVLSHLDIPIPDEMKGTTIEVGGARSASDLDRLRDRLADLGPRRSPVLAAIGVGWLVLFLAGGAIFGLDRARLPVLRIGGLGLLWLPSVILVPAALGNPSRTTELVTVVLLCLLLGWASDRLLGWPRAPILPAAIGLTALTIDLALGSDLITRSVLGPNPGYGSRFYGVGNELKAGLTVLMLAGVAGALSWRPKSANASVIVVGAGLVLGIVLGSGRLGAGVGAAIIVATATAVTAVMVYPGRMSAKRIALLVVSPVIGLALLAALDLATSGGEGHYIRNVIEDGSASSLLETVERRSTLAWQQLWRDNMPVVTLLAILVAAWGIRNRGSMKPWAGPIWPAVLIGGLAGGLVGSVTEDSGPLLLVSAVVTLVGVCSYLIGGPPSAGKADEESVTG